jgi:hypothetical protein
MLIWFAVICLMLSIGIGLYAATRVLPAVNVCRAFPQNPAPLSQIS